MKTLISVFSVIININRVLQSASVFFLLLNPDFSNQDFLNQDLKNQAVGYSTIMRASR